MNALRRLAILCTGGRLFERAALRGWVGAQLPADPEETDFGVDTDILVFFVDDEPVGPPGAAGVDKRGLAKRSN